MTVGIIAAGVGLSTFPVAVNLDGSSWLSKTSAYSGSANSNSFTAALYFDPLSFNAQQFLVHGRAASGDTLTRYAITLQADNTLDLEFNDSSGNPLARFISSGTFTTSIWRSLLVSLRTSNPSERFIYINDAAVAGTWSVYTSGNIDFTAPDHTVGAAVSGNSAFTGNLSEVWMDFGTYIDFSVEANRRKFIDSQGGPVPLGNTGQIPTGSQPTLCLNRSLPNWNSNVGSGGGLTLNGTLTAASTRP
jgi:hypothetical protein